MRLSSGHDFRPDNGKLGTLCSVFLSAKIVTGEYHMAMGYMKNPSLVIANPDRANILFMKSYKGPHISVKQGSVNEFDKNYYHLL